jgi:hypothetical protein
VRFAIHSPSRPGQRVKEDELLFVIDLRLRCVPQPGAGRGDAFGEDAPRVLDHPLGGIYGRADPGTHRAERRTAYDMQQL